MQMQESVYDGFVASGCVTVQILSLVGRPLCRASVVMTLRAGWGNETMTCEAQNINAYFKFFTSEPRTVALEVA